MKTKYPDQLIPGVFLPQDEYYDIPYGTMVSRDIDNLLVAGRCISAEFEAVGSARVIATCFAIGEAAGTAAVMSIQEKIIPAKLDVAQLQNNLRMAGIPL